MKYFKFLCVLCVQSLALVAAPLPVFVPDSGFRVAHPTYERIADMTYGKNAFALLEGNQAAVIAVGVGVREVEALPFSDGKYIAYGNGVFVVVGSEGSIASSPDLRIWRHHYFDGERIQTKLVSEADDPDAIAGFVSLVYVPEHAHFFAQTETGNVLISQNGEEWSIWGNVNEGAVIPGNAYPQVSETLAIFKSGDAYLKFERPDRSTMEWSVYQSQDGQNWTADGTLQTGSIPEKAFKRNTWVGMAGGACFLKVADQWVSEQYQDPGLGFPVQFSSGRYHDFAMLGLKDSYLVKYVENPLAQWTQMTPCNADNLIYLKNLDRFFLIHYGEGMIEVTWDGSSVYSLVDLDDVNVESIVDNNGYLLVAGRTSDGLARVYRSAQPVTDISLLQQDNVIEFSGETTGIDWTSYRYEFQGSPFIASGNGYFYLATDHYVYRSENGLDWEQVFQAEEHSWVISLFFYRGEMQIGTTNYFQANHIYTPPPEGVDRKNAIYSSINGDEWVEHVMNDQVYVRRASVDGPYLMEYQYNFPQSYVYYADTIDSFDSKVAPWWSVDGTIVWAYGRYYMFFGNTVVKTPYLGFEESEFQIAKENGMDLRSTQVDTGYFGVLNPMGSPIIHQTLGQISILDNLENEDMLYLMSPSWGILEYNRTQSPYVYSPVDQTTYYVNYHAGHDQEMESGSPIASRFYNHTTHEWSNHLTCESYSFEQWYQVLEQYVAELNTKAERLDMLINIQLGAVDAQKQMRRVDVANWIVQGLAMTVRNTISSDASQEEQNQMLSAVAALETQAFETYMRVSNAYAAAYGVNSVVY